MAVGRKWRKIAAAETKSRLADYCNFDDCGAPVPPDLAPQFRARRVFRNMVGRLQRVQDDIKRMEKLPGAEDLDTGRIVPQLALAQLRLAISEPSLICHCRAGCKLCGGRRWVSKQRLVQLDAERLLRTPEGYAGEFPEGLPALDNYLRRLEEFGGDQSGFD